MMQFYQFAQSGGQLQHSDHRNGNVCKACDHEKEIKQHLSACAFAAQYAAAHNFYMMNNQYQGNCHLSKSGSSEAVSKQNDSLSKPPVPGKLTQMMNNEDHCISPINPLNITSMRSCNSPRRVYSPRPLQLTSYQQSMNQMMGQISPKHNDKQGSLLINSKNGESSSNPIDADSNQQPVPFIQPFSVGGPGRFSLRSSDHWSPQLHQIMNNNQSSSSNGSSGSSK